MKSIRFDARSFVLAVASAAFASTACAAQLPWSQRVADAALARWPDGRTVPAGAPWFWNYELGTLLEGMDDVWLATVDPRYFNYIKSSVDQLVTPDGAIPMLKPEEHQLDDILLGRQLLLLYNITQEKRYLTAATFLHDQLAQQPRNAEGGYWHKQLYPNQMWLDGLYMAEPFRAQYAVLSHHPEEFADITHQFVVMEEHAHDPQSGLLYHGWDASKQERWANQQTGDSSEFWARGMGWYMMALVDTLDFYPDGDPGRARLIQILRQESAAIARFQDQKTGLWYTMMNKPGEKGNYFESSSACMFVYALAKGVRLGYLPDLPGGYRTVAEQGYKGILDHFARTDPNGDVSLTDTVKASGLGGEPYRDGSYAYYIGEKVVTNDPKGVGAFLMASTEMEYAPESTMALGDTVVIDGWFNSQERTDAFGRSDLYHYKWDTWDEPGYSLFGHLFREFGARTKVLAPRPSLAGLKGAKVYVIASPDNPDKNPHPNFATREDAEQIAEYVESGGVLVIMENDTSYADLDHFNVVSERFGIHFNSVLRKHVIDDDFEQGRIVIDGSGPIFHHPHNIYIKDASTITVSGNARPLIREGDDVFMATAKYGKGTVIAMTDPWLYNEYTNGRNLPATYDNYAAGKEFARWILQQIPTN
ncbi:MAG: glycoside hydrolase family 88 protein [Terracidiphilus sp.]|jgi:unsaturated rhamnogalacturonyl hydrolase